MDRDEKDQVTAATSGNAEVFGRLVEGHAGWMLARISSRLGSRDTAEDLLQEVFLAAWEAAVDRHPPGSVSVVAEAAELMACVEGIEPYLRPRHRVESPGWIYNPLVEIRLSGTESRLTLRTSRDQGFSRVEEDAPPAAGEPTPRVSRP